MTESESYWLNLVEELAAITQPLRGNDSLNDEPAWVIKLTCELFNMATPKMQIRAGAKPTADKIGVMVGSNLVQMAAAEAMAKVPRPTSAEGRSAFVAGMKLATPPDDSFNREATMAKLAATRASVISVVGRVLMERDLREASEFFRGLSRGLAQNPKAIVPTIENGVPRYTPEQLEKLGRMVIYLAARHRWRELEQLKTSQQAFEWFEKLIPAQFLGNDPERIRKMFYRFGKKFKAPGRPKIGTGPS